MVTMRMRLSEKNIPPMLSLALFAGYHFQPYHMGFYGEDVPIQYNEYLFATRNHFQSNMPPCGAPALKINPD